MSGQWNGNAEEQLTTVAGRQSRYWCFTLNNPDETQDGDDPNHWGGLAYAVWQLERGENGTRHFQGFCVFTTKKSLSGCKRLSQRAHWGIMRTNVEACIAYCTKQDTREGGPWSVGERPRGPTQGRRTDLERIKRRLDSGESVRAIAQDHFSDYLRYAKGFNDYRKLVQQRRSTDPIVIILWGPTGIGKSRYASSVAPRTHAYWKDPGEWWEGYDGESVVVWDEFRRDNCKITDLLRWFDRYPVNAMVKGGSVPLHANLFILTSNEPSREWFLGADGEHQRALQRRIGLELELRQRDWTEQRDAIDDAIRTRWPHLKLEHEPAAEDDGEEWELTTRGWRRVDHSA